MSERKSKGCLIATVAWCFIFLILAIAYKFLVHPYFSKKLTEDTSSNSRYDHEINIAADSFSGYAVLRSPFLKKWLSEKQIKLNVIDDGADYSGRLKSLEERNTQLGYGTYRLLIVTDGEANDRDLVEKHTPEVLSRGLRVDVIGVAMKQDHTLATKVHTYRRANDASTLKQAIAEVFAEVGSQQGNLADEDAFDILEPLPVEFASTAIASLSNSGNEPIGSASKQNRRSNPQRTQTHRAPNSQRQPDSVTIEKSGTTIKFVFLGLIVLLVVLKAFVKKL